MPVPEIRPGIRIVASPSALDGAAWPGGAVVVRLAPDEAVVLETDVPDLPADPHALVEVETGMCGVEMSRAALEDWLSREAEWSLPPGDGSGQGMAAGLPVKVWTEGKRALVLTRASLAAELEERL